MHGAKVDAFREREGTGSRKELKQQTDAKTAQLGRQGSDPTSYFDYQKDHAGLNVLLALVLYNCTISSLNDLELPVEEAGRDPERADSELHSLARNQDDEAKLRDPAPEDGQNAEEAHEDAIRLTDDHAHERSRHGRSQMSELQADIANVLELLNLDPADSSKSPPGSAFPAKIPVSSVVLSLLFLIQSPLPFAVSVKKTDSAREQLDSRHGRKYTKSRQGRAGRPDTAKGDVAKCFALAKRDIAELLAQQLRTIRSIFSNSGQASLSRSYLLNSLLFFCLLCAGSDTADAASLPSELSFLVQRQPLQESLALVEVLGVLLDAAPAIMESPRQ